MNKKPSKVEIEEKKNTKKKLHIMVNEKISMII